VNDQRRPSIKIANTTVRGPDKRQHQNKSFNGQIL